MTREEMIDLAVRKCDFGYWMLDLIDRRDDFLSTGMIDVIRFEFRRISNREATNGKAS